MADTVPEVGVVYEDDGRRLLRVYHLAPGDPQGREVRGFVKSHGEEFRPYSASAGSMFAVIWKRVVTDPHPDLWPAEMGPEYVPHTRGKTAEQLRAEQQPVEDDA